MHTVYDMLAVGNILEYFVCVFLHKSANPVRAYLAPSPHSLKLVRDAVG